MMNRYMVLSLVALVSCGLHGMEESTPKKLKNVVIGTFFVNKTIKKQRQQEKLFTQKLNAHIEAAKNGHNRSASLRSFAQQKEENAAKLLVSEPTLLGSESKTVIKNKKAQQKTFEVKQPSEDAQKLQQERIENLVNESTHKRTKSILRDLKQSEEIEKAQSTPKKHSTGRWSQKRQTEFFNKFK